MTGMGKHALSKLRAGLEDVRRRQSAAVTVLVVVIAAGLAAYCAAASYDTVSHLAARYGVALPRLNPLGIDGGLAGLIIMDIALTWLGEPIWWLRLAVRVFAAGMVGANAAAGWPSLTGTGLRIAAPVLFVIITEAGRTWLLRRLHAAERERRAAARKRRRDNRIPRIRWLLDFRGTFALWKRMRLWREPSYRVAVNMELERLAAIEKLAMRYGAEGWEQAAPADLAWMLKSGVRMPEALARVPELIGTEDAVARLRGELEAAGAARADAERRAAEAEAQAATFARKAPANSGAKTPRKRPARNPAGSSRKTPATATETEVPDDFDAQAEALRILAAEPRISGAKLAERVGRSERWGQLLKSNLAKAAPQGIDAGNGERS
jgi:hypothetical protein